MCNRGYRNDTLMNEIEYLLRLRRAQRAALELYAALTVLYSAYGLPAKPAKRKASK